MYSRVHLKMFGIPGKRRTFNFTCRFSGADFADLSEQTIDCYRYEDGIVRGWGLVIYTVFIVSFITESLPSNYLFSFLA